MHLLFFKASLGLSNWVEKVFSLCDWHMNHCLKGMYDGDKGKLFVGILIQIQMC